MDRDDISVAGQLTYLAKVLGGLSILAALVVTALWLPQAELGLAQQRVATVLLGLAALALVPAVRWVYVRRDEMLQRQHQQASMHALALCAAMNAVCGVLQAADWLPLFNQFWTLGLLIFIWAVQLVRADWQHKA